MSPYRVLGKMNVRQVSNGTRDDTETDRYDGKKVMRKWRKISTGVSPKCVRLCVRKAVLTREALEREEGPLALGHEGWAWEESTSVNSDKNEQEWDKWPSLLFSAKAASLKCLSLQREQCGKCGPWSFHAAALSQAVGKLCKHLVCETIEMSIFIYTFFFFLHCFKKIAHLL